MQGGSRNSQTQLSAHKRNSLAKLALSSETLCTLKFCQNLSFKINPSEDPESKLLILIFPGSKGKYKTSCVCLFLFFSVKDFPKVNKDPQRFLRNLNWSLKLVNLVYLTFNS